MRSFLVGIFAVLFVANLVCWLSIDSILLRLAQSQAWRVLFGLFFLIQVAGLAAMIGARVLGQQPGAGLGRPLLSLVMIWNLLLAVPAAVVYLVAAILACFLNADGTPVPRDMPLHDRVVCAVAVFPALAVLATLVALRQLRMFRVRQLKLTVPKLPEALKGLTILHLSDLHVGKLTRGTVLEEMVNTVNDLEPDIAVVTGDIINMALDDLPTALHLLKRMNSHHGLFLCEGNHDLIESRSGFEEAARNSGVRFLLNDSAVIPVRGQRVQMLGLRWGEGTARAEETAGHVASSALERLLAQREAGDFTILLAHHPEAFDAAAKAGIPLTLSGHTHGGQLMLTPRFGFGPWFYRYWSGLYRQGDSQLVVCNGTGNWFPLRIGAPAEMIHLTLE